MENSLRPSLWRSVLSTICLVASVIAAPISISAAWAAGHLTDTDGFVKTMSPLAQDQELQELVSEQVAQSVSDHLRIEERLDEVTGTGWLSSLIPTEEIATKANQAIENSALRVVQSENFASLWQTALRTSHQSTDRIFTGQSSASLDQAGNLTFKLDDVVAELSKSLTGLGIPDLPATGNFEWNMKLIQSDALPTVQKAYLLVDRVGPWALYLNAAVLIAGVLLGPRHLSKALLWVALVSGLSFIALKTLIPDYIQERMLSNIDSEVAREIFDQMSSGLATSLTVTAVAAGLLGAASIPLSRKWALHQRRSTARASLL